MKKLPVVLLILLLALGLFVCANAEENVPAATRLEGPGYDTPEEAVMAYIDAMNRGDVSGMLSTFAIESYVAYADPVLRLQYLGRYQMYNAWSTTPLKDEFVRSLAVINRGNYIAGLFKQSYLAYALKEDYSAFAKQDTAAARAELEEQFRASPLNNMAGHVEFVRWVSPAALTEGKIMKPGIGGDTIEMLASAGGDDYTELVAELRINGLPACQAMQCVRYRDRWYNLDLNTRTAIMSNLPGASSNTAGLYFLMSRDESGEEAGQPGEAARWEALQQSSRAGTRWPLVSLLGAPDITVHETADAAEDDSGAGIWAEMHFTRVGGAMITLRVSPSLQQRLGMESTVSRIRFSWFADEIPVFSVRNKGGKEILMPLFRFLNNQKADAINLGSLDVTTDDETITITFENGIQAVFRKPAAVPEAAPVSAETETSAPARLEGSGYNTPEEAVLAYLDAMNRGNVREMLSTFALETYAANAYPMFNVELLGIYNPKTSLYLPDFDEYSRALLVRDRYDTVASGLMNAWVSYATGTDEPIQLQTNEEIQALLNQFDASPLNGMTGNVSFTGWIDPVRLNRSFYYDNADRRSLVTSMVLNGGDDEAILAAMFTVNGKPGLLSMRCVRYDGRWYNDGPESNIVFKYLSSGSPSRMYLWIPTSDEQLEIMGNLAADVTRLTARRDAIRECGLGGTRWILTDMNGQGISACDTAEEAEADKDKAIQSDMRLFSTGCGAITFTASPALQEMLGTDSAVNRIIFTWEPDTSGRLMLTGLFVYPRTENSRHDETVTATRTDAGITLTFPDGTEATFRKAEN